MADAVIEHCQQHIGGRLIGPHGEDRSGQPHPARESRGRDPWQRPESAGRGRSGSRTRLPRAPPAANRTRFRPCGVPLAAARFRGHGSAAARAPGRPPAAAWGRFRQHAGSSYRPAAAASTASERRSEGPPDCSGREPLRRWRARNRACPRKLAPPTRSAARRTTTLARTSRPSSSRSSTRPRSISSTAPWRIIRIASGGRSPCLKMTVPAEKTSTLVRAASRSRSASSRLLNGSWTFMNSATSCTFMDSATSCMQPARGGDGESANAGQAGLRVRPGERPRA